MASQTTTSRRYIGGFDGLRTLGVIGVILYHLRPELFRGGYLGVLIFMVISGYLLTDGFLREYAQTGRLSLRAFWGRRVRRLYPALVAVLFGTGALMVLFARQLLANFHKIVLTNLTFTYNWWQIANGQSYFDRFANNESPFTHLWTLSIEGQFYLLWPVLFLLLMRRGGKRTRALGVTLGLALASAIWMAVLCALHPAADPSRLYYGTDTRAFALLLGAALAFVWPSDRLAVNLSRSARWFLDAAGTLAALALVWGLLSLNAQGDVVYEGGMFAFTCATTVLVAVVASPATLWGKLFTNRAFHWVGARSYGIYLYQFPVMILWEVGVRNVAAHPVLYPVIEVALILAISALSYRFLEQPIAHRQWHLRPAQWTWPRVTGRAVLLMVLGLGTVALFLAPGVKDQANDSAVAKALRANEATAADDKASLATIKRRIAADQSSRAASSKSAASAASQSSAATLPEAVSAYTAYGIDTAALTVAQGLTVTAVGDSVMLDAKPTLAELLPHAYIDAGISRQMYQGLDLIQGYAQSGALAKVVVIGSGTNGAFTTNQLDQVMTAVGTDRQVFWINAHVPTRPWQNAVNQLLDTAAKRYSNLTIIDWCGVADAHAEWFYDDQVHMNPTGNKYYAALVVNQIVQHLK
ncbi:acyltransferase family protein [Lacticaseibacillus daqingensis]|uniref:acyltransferase family protein n=1 Tax=Lacticaseibacillus daqingensis TaxID=2486014 RepID=UPI000F785159|nr:acyltransferase family protein [Lacticaseibacillus daqingensis]